MQDMSWLHNPALKDIHPKKIEVITQLVKNTEGKPIAQSIPFLMQANKELQKEGLAFNEEETALIMDILTRDMTAAEKQHVHKMIGMFKEKLKNL